jgi:hypothetical protein
MKKNIKEIYELWVTYPRVSIFGLSHVCKNTLEKVKAYGVNYIFDNNPKLDGKRYSDIEIKLFDGKNESHLQEKILIATHYKEIASQLKQLGLKENIDFCALDLFCTIMDWHDKNKIYINEVHMSVTTKCTLHCKNCNMFMTEYKEPCHLELSELKRDVDRLFDKVDEISTFALLGGEPLLYPDLDDLILYINKKYGNRIGRIEIITNGTIVPKRESLKIYKEKKVFFRISDYSNSIQYKSQLMKLKEALQEHEIEYYLNESLMWLDFGFPYNPVHIPDNMVYQHMLDCFPTFKGVNDGKLYFCHIVWSANKCGIYKEKKTDYIDLEHCTHQEIVDYVLGIMEKPVSLCGVCAGCSSDNTNVIKVAVQR